MQFLDTLLRRRKNHVEYSYNIVTNCTATTQREAIAKGISHISLYSNEIIFDSRTDQMSLYQDWKKVGEDIYYGIEEVGNESKARQTELFPA